MTAPNTHATLLTPHASRITATICSCAALAIVFAGLLQFDLPITHYLRTVTTHQAGEQLTIPWMAFTSHAGDWIGEGRRLVAVSLIVLAAGWALSRPTFKRAGIDSLLAHGLAALLSNGLKHLLGRPRPKFVHSGEWQFTPTWASGLDSFPSGHTTASFAVATVLAKRFPAFSLLSIGVAVFVGLSRILRGSHFPTDVFGGAVLGILSGSIASAPWNEWRAALEDGLRHAAIGTAGVFALLWTLARPADGGVTGALLLGLGGLVLASGLWLRHGRWIGRRPLPTDRQDKASPALIAYGLACMTTAPLVVASVGLACLAYWLQGEAVRSPVSEEPSRLRTILAEGALMASLLVALTILLDGRAVLPFQ